MQYLFWLNSIQVDNFKWMTFFFAFQIFSSGWNLLEIVEMCQRIVEYSNLVSNVCGQNERNDRLSASA